MGISTTIVACAFFIAIILFIIVSVVLFVIDSISAKKENRSRNAIVTGLFIISMTFIGICIGLAVLYGLLTIAVMKGM